MARKKTPDVMGEVLGKKGASDKGGAGTLARKTAKAPATKPAPATPTQKQEQASQTEQVSASQDDRQAQRIIDRHAMWAAGVGLVPVPFVELVVLTGLQVRMLSALARHYDVHFYESAGRSLIASLTSSVGANALGRGMLGSALKSIPFVGWLVAPFVVPAAAGALTYALGKVFVQHFESGGTFLTADTDAYKKSFKEQYRQGLAFFGQHQSSS